MIPREKIICDVPLSRAFTNGIFTKRSRTQGYLQILFFGKQSHYRTKFIFDLLFYYKKSFLFVLCLVSNIFP